MPMAKSSKRITIKPFRKPPQLPPDYYSKTSQALLQATAALLSPGSAASSNSSLQHAYTSVVNLVSHQFGPQLYADLVLQLKNSAAAVLPSDLPLGAHPPILNYLEQNYPKYVNYLLLTRHVFMALDRPYVWDEEGKAVKRASAGQGTVLEVGLRLFQLRLQELGYQETMFRDWSQLLWNSFSQTSLPQLPLLESTMNIWKDLGMARRVILQTQPLLQRSFSQVSKEWHSMNDPYSAEAFLNYVHQQWHYVSNKWGQFLPKTWLRSLLEVHLLEPHLNGDYLLRDNIDITNLQHCQKLWQLAGRLDGGLARVLEATCQQTKLRGIAIATSQQSSSSPSKTVISSLLGLQSELTSLKQCVGDNIQLKPVWTEIMNQSPLIAEWLAKYIDLEFKNFKSETSLEPLLFLFTHVQAKDVFEAFYKKDLAKRLLLNRVSSMDLERQFVSLLKTECGAGYTSKMEGMFQDVEWSRESLSRYKSSPDFHPTSVDFEVQILTTGYWPVYPQFEKLELPQGLQEPRDYFMSYYKTKYQGRKIAWQYALGNCMVKFKTSSGKTFEFICNLCMALVLTCFQSDQDEWTLPNLMARIGLDDRDEMERTIWSLFHGKEQARVLKRISTTKTDATTKKGVSIADTDVFTINDKFTCNLRRIKIPNMLKKETKEERDKVVEAVSRDRLYLIDAVLVRIMKARKTILHQQLIPQVLEQVKTAQPADIKKRIESLLEREYMERDEADRNRYNYLA